MTRSHPTPRPPATAGPCPICRGATVLPYCPRDGAVLRRFALGDRYEVDELIGAGATAFVFGGRHLGLGRDVAVKVLRPARAGDREDAQRFLREAQIASRVDHPNIAAVFDVGHDAGLDVTYLAMERVRGENLDQLLRREGPLPWSRAVAILAQVARAVAAAHELGIVHRDLSPRNVLLTATSRCLDVVKLCDFGLSRRSSGSDRITATGAFVGTPAYMAPEQIEGAAAVDHRVDLYAIATIGYELVTGALPIAATSPGTMLAAKLAQDPRGILARFPGLDLPPALDELLTRGLARDPAARPASAEAMASALVEIATGSAALGAAREVIGSQIGTFVVRALIGTGGTGAVYLAEHPVIGRRVAIKVLHAELASSAELVDRFVREARAANSIASPSMLRYFDFGRLPDGRPYAVMEYLGGETLAERLARDGARPIAEVVALVTQVALAMGRAHAAGLIHRDLKPENLLITVDEAGAPLVKILDFGIAKALEAPREPATATRAGVFLGTPLYCAPEQSHGGEITPATDVYALGVIAFEALTGAPPFAGEPVEIAAQKLSPRRIAQALVALPAAVGSDLGAMLAPATAMRIGAMDEVCRRVGAWLAADAAPVPHDGDQRPTLPAAAACPAPAIAEPWFDAEPAGVDGPEPAPDTARARRWAIALGAAGALVVAVVALLAIASTNRGAASPRAAGSPSAARSPAAAPTLVVTPIPPDAAPAATAVAPQAPETAPTPATALPDAAPAATAAPATAEPPARPGRHHRRAAAAPPPAPTAPPPAPAAPPPPPSRDVLIADPFQ